MAIDEVKMRQVLLLAGLANQLGTLLTKFDQGDVRIVVAEGDVSLDNELTALRAVAGEVLSVPDNVIDGIGEVQCEVVLTADSAALRDWCHERVGMAITTLVGEFKAKAEELADEKIEFEKV